MGEGRVKVKGRKLKKEIARYIFLVSGFFVISFGLVLMFETDLGVPPWDVFHLGVYGRLGLLTRGQVMQGTGLFLILFSCILGVRPHTATLLNMVFIGLFIDLIYFLNIVHISGGPAFRVLVFFTGSFLMGVGTATYLTANRGAGPRDSLMVGIAAKTGLNMGLVRTFIEVFVTLTGILLGGPFGAGTFMFALSIGFFMQLGFRFYRSLKRSPLYSALLRRFFPEGKSLERSSSHA